METYPWMHRAGFVELHQGGPDALAWATFALVLLLVLTVGALLVARLARRRPHRWPGPGPFPGPPRRGGDPLDLLRWRYARGEISRDEFVQGTSDLAAAAPTAEPPPS